jgi:cysteine dioxygenase
VTGELTETIFDAVEPGYVRPGKINRYRQGYVCSSVDRDIHQILNHQPAGCELITLHIYSPPLASMNSYSLLEESPLPAVAT